VIEALPGPIESTVKRAIERTLVFCEMIKIRHTLFALPFALGSAFVAARGLPAWQSLAKICLAVLCARTAAMAFNRYTDRVFDARNPRTSRRALPAGLVSPKFVLGACAAAAAGFIATSAWINALAFALSPLALAVILGYSLTKRFTNWCHFVLGSALALAPLGAWVAITGQLSDGTPWLLAAVVLLWTAGFDLLYACQDAEFDRREGLRSVPARYGVPFAFRLSAWLHGSMVLTLALLWRLANLGPWFAAAVLLVAVLLAYEHALVRPHDLRRIERAFFAVNGIVSFLLMAALMLGAGRPLD
jgi:4-hydroxybenzoate polyprenyltransferase